MKVSYQYAGPSSCRQLGEEAVLGFSPDLSRDERVSFRARMKNPLVFRDAMLMLRQIVMSDMGKKKKERVEFLLGWSQKLKGVFWSMKNICLQLGKALKRIWISC